MSAGSVTSRFHQFITNGSSPLRTFHCSSRSQLPVPCARQPGDFAALQQRVLFIRTAHDHGSTNVILVEADSQEAGVLRRKAASSGSIWAQYAAPLRQDCGLLRGKTALPGERGSDSIRPHLECEFVQAPLTWQPPAFFTFLATGPGSRLCRRTDWDAAPGSLLSSVRPGHVRTGQGGCHTCSTGFYPAPLPA